VALSLIERLYIMDNMTTARLVSAAVLASVIAVFLLFYYFFWYMFAIFSLLLLYRLYEFIARLIYDDIMNEGRKK